MLLQIVICSLKHIVILSRYIEFIRKYTGAWPKSWTCVLSLQLWDCIPYDSQLMFTFNPAFVLSLEKQDNLAPAIRVGDSDGIPGSCGHSVSLSVMWAMALGLCLPPSGHGFQPACTRAEAQLPDLRVESDLWHDWRVERNRHTFWPITLSFLGRSGEVGKGLRGPGFWKIPSCPPPP